MYQFHCSRCFQLSWNLLKVVVCDARSPLFEGADGLFNCGMLKGGFFQMLLPLCVDGSHAFQIEEAS